MCAITAFHQQEVICSCCDALSPVSLRLQPKWSIIETGLYKKRYSAYNLLERWTVSLNTHSVFGTMIRQHETLYLHAHTFFFWWSISTLPHFWEAQDCVCPTTMCLPFRIALHACHKHAWRESYDWNPSDLMFYVRHFCWMKETFGILE